MIVPIEIDTSDLISQFNLSKNEIEDVCDDIAKTLAAQFANELQHQANENLNQTRKRYIQNIRVVDSGRMEGTVLLDFSKDKLIKMLEQGAQAFDMKPYLLASSKAKVNKNNKKYISIPFRWATPGTVGESDVFNGHLTDQVYKAVKDRDTLIPMSGGGSRSIGLSAREANELEPVKKRASIESDGRVLFKEYEHKTSIYAGLTKQKDATTGQNTYHTFRTVSEESSDEQAFIHKGIESYNLINKALDNFDQQAELSTALDKALIKLGF